MYGLNDAQNIARREVATIISEDPDLTGEEVDEIDLKQENNLVWIFAAEIPRLVREGWVPGAITVFVDKKDGHVWTAREQEEFHHHRENTRRRAGFIRQK